MVNIDFSQLKRSEKYYFMTSTIVPRPIAVVGTRNESGNDNLASFSYFNAVSSEPPILMFVVTHGRNGAKKDTLVNIERTHEFVVHIAQSDQFKEVDETGEALPYGMSEREKLGLHLSPSTWIKTPRVTEFKVAYECTLEKLVELDSSTVVFGRILGAHVERSLLLRDPESGLPIPRVDSIALDPLARMDRGYGKIAAQLEP